jgi:CBS domain-containing protein
MTSPAIVVGPVESLATVAKLMDAERVKRVPVVDGHRRLVGIVSRRDLLRLYLRDDESIRTEIVQEVLLRTLWIPSGTITVAVDRGVVSLSGTVDRRSTVPLVARLVEGIAGVVDVANHLTYHFDDTADPDRSHPAFG